MNRPRQTSVHLSRRQLLAAGAAAGTVVLAGCLGDSEDVPDPVSLDQGQTCDNCDMQIDVHPGPVGQAYYLDDPPAELPEGREDGLAHFCSSWCTYTYVLEREGEAEPAGIYLTDYSLADEEVYDDGGTLVVSSHLGAESFADAQELTYVVASDVEGAMGQSLIGFSETDDAETFANEYDGELVEYDDITLELLATL
jgi:copper chaperone NosL